MKDPVFSKEDAYNVLDLKQSYERSCQKGLQMMKLAEKYNITKEEEIQTLERYIKFYHVYSCSDLI